MKEEVFSIVDANDRIIGQATRSEVHGNPDLIHRVVHVLVFNAEGDLFLQKRSETKDVQPGKWDTSVGGHVDQGESYLQAACREAEEELGIRGMALVFLYKYLHANDFESEYVSTFRTVWDGPIWINREEISEGRFWQLAEIEAEAETGVFTPNFLDELARYRMAIGRGD